ncbi:hypothetical protein C4C32_17975 [Pseudomonas corrugata]|uniref:HeH/LEM domain-containing protein n=1 Tax=Pseudomonas corrugata TaxID=47879 RepID=A0A8B6UKP8_9PSED|nr:hypothetical protein [Pseudomonas corrugata]QTH12475.1 hypothetical protein C4C32_17975 [Pseudomonas corrugata]
MELTYSAQTSDFDPDKRYRNPQYFDKPESGVTKVTVVGNWPAVVEAYKTAKVEVDVIEAGGSAETDPANMGVADLRAWLTAQGIEFDPKAPKAEIQKLIPAS